MKDEMKSMQDNDVEISSNFLKDSKGYIERYKTCLVAKGFTQKEDINYKETFSPLSSKDSFRTIMTLIIHFDLELHQMDVKTAFQNGDIGKTANVVDDCAYHKFSENKYIFLVLYVDDILLASIDIGLYRLILRYRSQGILGFSQENYINKVLDRFNMKDSKPRDTPIAKRDKFSLKQCPNNDLERNEMQNITYASIVESLMYTQICTRPDIAFVVGVLDKYLSDPGMQHWNAVKCVMCYLKRTKEYVLTYRKSEGLEIIRYSNSDFARCQDSKRSTS
ncbi:hypothetical protein CR513_21373, partial [Mucuna pruriens]